jgi:glucan phosphoethanolaminetransferase (alkaline phosphatase superfamily)
MSMKADKSFGGIRIQKNRERFTQKKLATLNTKILHINGSHCNNCYIISDKSLDVFNKQCVSPEDTFSVVQAH